MTAEPTHNQPKQARNFLGKAAGRCGGALNSFLVVVGDKCGLYTTGQYSFDVEQPIVSAGAHGSATPGKNRAMSVQREEAAVMTLVLHDCAAATDSHMATPKSP